MPCRKSNEHWTEISLTDANVTMANVGKNSLIAMKSSVIYQMTAISVKDSILPHISVVQEDNFTAVLQIGATGYLINKAFRHSIDLFRTITFKDKTKGRCK